MLTSYITKHAGRYNISEMSIVFGILVTLGIFPVLGVGALLYYVLGTSTALAVITSVTLWLGLVVWLWVSFVITGRQSPNTRISTGELRAMQVICTLIIGLQSLFSSPQERLALEAFGNMFAWVVVGFHAIYFTLAWAIRARVPLRTYLMFALIIGILVLRGI